MKKNTSLLFLIRIIKLLVGILNLSLTAKYFGVSLEKDVWLLAISVILFLDMAVWGPINETFRSKFVFLKGEIGEAEALQKTKSLLFFTFIISVGIVCVVSIYPQILSKIIAPTYSGVQYDGLIRMIVIAAPIMLITQLSAIGISILNAYESFFVPEITGFITAVVNLVLLIFLAPYIGIYSLVISYYVGAVLLLVLLFVQIRKLQISIFIGYNDIKFKDFKIFFLFALPFFFPYFFGQVSGVLEKTLVSTIGVGNVSALDYSRKFTDILTSVLTSVLFTMLVPVLSLKYIQKKPKEFVLNFMEIFQLGMLFLTFVITLFTSTSLSVVSIFFDKGMITKDTLQEISNLTIFYSWSTLAVFIYLVFGVALLSSDRSKKYAFWGVIAQIISISLNFIFIKSIGIYIFPISLLLSHFIVGVIMSFYFPYKNKRLTNVFFKYVSILVLTTSLVFLINKFVNFQINSFLHIASNSILTLIIIGLLAVLFNLEEKHTMYAYLNKFKQKCRDF